MEKPAPRVNATMVEKYNGGIVKVVGKIKSKDGETAVIETSDGGELTVILNRDSNYSDPYVEVIGKVNEKNEIIEYTSRNIGDNIDMELVEKITLLTQQYPDLFPVE